jgi:hypothetical protein
LTFEHKIKVIKQDTWPSFPHRLWILGGAGETAVLRTTELLTFSQGAITQVEAGPEMPEPLMNHCAAWVTPTQVLVLGGFSSLINDYTPTASMYDLTTQQWIRRTSINVGPRIDASCLNVGLGFQESIL